MTASRSDQRFEARPAQLAAISFIGSVVVQIIWRMAIAPAILGNIDPSSDMPPRDRATLALGLLCGAAIMAIGMALLSRALGGTSGYALSQWAVGSASLGLVLLATNIALLFAKSHFLGLIYVFAVLTSASWILACVSCYRARVLKWSALATGILAGVCGASIVSGAFIVFVMSLSLLPLAIGLILRTRRTTSTVTAPGVRPDIA